MCFLCSDGLRESAVVTKTFQVEATSNYQEATRSQSADLFSQTHNFKHSRVINCTLCVTRIFEYLDVCMILDQSYPYSLM